MGIGSFAVSEAVLRRKHADVEGKVSSAGLGGAQTQDVQIRLSPLNSGKLVFIPLGRLATPPQIIETLINDSVMVILRTPCDF
jgi:hypothetical protein